MSTNRTVNSVHQDEFDKKYISSKEICDRLKISKSSLLLGNKNGYLPEPITITGISAYIWIRAECVEMLDAWEKLLNAKRNKKGNL